VPKTCGQMLNRLRRAEGQALVFVVLAVPLFFAMAMVVVDGSQGYAKKRQMQNASDAAALAAAADLQPALDPATCDAACLSGVRVNVKATVESYSAQNGGPDHLTGGSGADAAQCAQPSDTNCYTWPYHGSDGKVEVRLQTTVSNFFAKIFGFAAGFLKPRTRSVAAATGSTETHCEVNGVRRDDLSPPGCSSPGQQGTPQHIPAHCDSGDLNSNPPCLIPGNAGTGTFAFAMGNGCDAITITSGNDDFRQGALWSNGGIKASGARDILAAYRFGSTDDPASPAGNTGTSGLKTCYNENGTDVGKTLNVATDALTTSIVLNGIPTGATAIVNGDHIAIDNETMLVTAGGGTATLTVTRHVLNTTASPHARGAAVYHLGPDQFFDAASPAVRVDPNYYPRQTTWPRLMPPIPATCSSTGARTGGGDAGTTNINTASNWLTQTNPDGSLKHPPGVYCWTAAAGTVNVNINTCPTITTFDGYEFVSQATNTAFAIGGGGCQKFTGVYESAPDLKVAFYATVGDVSVTQGITLADAAILAPGPIPPGNRGVVTFTGASNTQTGLIEAQKITINNNGQSFTGLGPGQNGTPDTYGQYTPPEDHCVFSPPIPNPDQYLPSCTAPGEQGTPVTTIIGVSLSMDE
jgi:Flp pilus assembly protein TadG